MICPSCRTDNIEGADECANCGQPLYGLDVPDEPAGKQAPEFMRQPLGALKRRPTSQVNLNDPVALVVRLMQTSNTSAVFVMDGEDVSGIITGWDILHKVAAPKADLHAVTCREIMSTRPVVFSELDTVAVALNKMASGEFRHIPIASTGQPLSAVDIDDLFRYLLPYLV